ncbi:MAG TPA: KUP/HAK/KT family potassium transporter [Chitinophagales bacterium]|nr:KUP/HAK/KT family potassium transporter [Chitinophagales bacterium]
MSTDNHLRNKLSVSGLLITLGIIYGDIGTSPLYVMKAIIGNKPIQPDIIFGALSCIFWTLIIVTTFKYVILVMQADNQGEGGIFSLYALVKKHQAKWPLIAALIGCSALLADGFITPPISISSAVEGMNILYPDLPTIPVVLTILFLLFIFQQFGTGTIGKTFGPIMLLWFTTLGVLGLLKVIHHPEIFKALNPVYAFDLLFNHPGGFWILGAVFLCTTGAEALYADMGHCGKRNIQISWIYVLACLLLNYMGQSIWCLQHRGISLNDVSPFYELIPKPYLTFLIILATVATIIASQALISGCFTLVSEAIKQRLWINLKVDYPSDSKGQVYIPVMNWVLMSGCIFIIILFKRSANMEAAYGLTITIDMLMTTSLLLLFFKIKNKSLAFIIPVGVLFFSIESVFLMSNLKKFFYGGWFTFFIASVTFFILFCLHKARAIRDTYNNMVNLDDFKGMFSDLIQDTTIPKTATNLVYMSKKSKRTSNVDSNIIYSIFQQNPKRADVYWFIHVDTLDYPHEHEKNYYVKTIIPGKVFFVRLEFGFKVKHKVNRLFHKIVEHMVELGEVDELSRYPSMRQNNIKADFKFVFIKPKLSEDNDLKPNNLLVMNIYELLSKISYPPYKEFGLDTVNTEIELTPLQIHHQEDLIVHRKEGFE